MTTATVKTASLMASNPVYPIIFAIGGCHLLNDSLQSVIPAMFPVLEKDLGLTFTQLGLIAFALNMVASVLQPVRTSVCPAILDDSHFRHFHRTWFCHFPS